MGEIQLWPAPPADGTPAAGVADLPPSTHVFTFQVGGFPFGTYGYSLQSPPAASSTTIVVEEVFRGRNVTDADVYPVPTEGQLVPPTPSLVKDRKAYAGRIMTQLRITITNAEVLVGFALYGNFGRQGDLR